MTITPYLCSAPSPSTQCTNSHTAAFSAVNRSFLTTTSSAVMPSRATSPNWPSARWISSGDMLVSKKPGVSITRTGWPLYSKSVYWISLVTLRTRGAGLRAGLRLERQASAKGLDSGPQAPGSGAGLGAGLGQGSAQALSPEDLAAGSGLGLAT